jgi:hypothetical protein
MEKEKKRLANVYIYNTKEHICSTCKLYISINRPATEQRETERDTDRIGGNGTDGRAKLPEGRPSRER